MGGGTWGRGRAVGWVGRTLAGTVVVWVLFIGDWLVALLAVAGPGLAVPYVLVELVPGHYQLTVRALPGLLLALQPMGAQIGLADLFVAVLTYLETVVLLHVLVLVVDIVGQPALGAGLDVAPAVAQVQVEPVAREGFLAVIAVLHSLPV